MIVVVIGGTRSGKSELGETIAARLGEPITVVVPGEPDDPDFAARVAAHQARRPASWATLECGSELPAALTRVRGTVLVDSLGSWIARCPDLHVDPAPLVETLRARRDATVLVTEEVGLAVHPATEAGRRFTDALGALNAAVAHVADDVWLCVAGRVTRLERPDAALEGR